MVSSTEIPKAILKTKIVEGFSGIPVKPITPAVIISGSKLGIKEMIIILNERKRKAIKSAINRMARLRERIRFLIRYFVPFKKSNALPVISAPYLFFGKIFVIAWRRSDSMLSIRSVLISFMYVVILPNWPEVST